MSDLIGRLLAARYERLTALEMLAERVRTLDWYRRGDGRWDTGMIKRDEAHALRVALDLVDAACQPRDPNEPTGAALTSEIAEHGPAAPPAGPPPGDGPPRGDTAPPRGGQGGASPAALAYARDWLAIHRSASHYPDDPLTDSLARAFDRFAASSRLPRTAEGA